MQKVNFLKVNKSDFTRNLHMSGFFRISKQRQSISNLDFRDSMIIIEAFIEGLESNISEMTFFAGKLPEFFYKDNFIYKRNRYETLIKILLSFESTKEIDFAAVIMMKDRKALLYEILMYYLPEGNKTFTDKEKSELLRKAVNDLLRHAPVNNSDIVPCLDQAPYLNPVNDYIAGSAHHQDSVSSSSLESDSDTDMGSFVSAAPAPISAPVAAPAPASIAEPAPDHITDSAHDRVHGTEPATANTSSPSQMSAESDLFSSFLFPCAAPDVSDIPESLIFGEKSSDIEKKKYNEQNTSYVMNPDYNPCASCRFKICEEKKVENDPGPGGRLLIKRVKDYFDSYFERSNPLNNSRRDYNWWKLDNPFFLHNILFECGLRVSLLYNPAIFMAYYKHGHLLAGFYEDCRQGRQFIVIGVPTSEGSRERPFGDAGSLVKVRTSGSHTIHHRFYEQLGSITKKSVPQSFNLYGQKLEATPYGYWLLYIDPETGKIKQ